MPKPRTFADTLYLARTQRALTQKQTAEAVGISARQYRDLELGKADPKLSTAIRLADFLDIALDTLRGGKTTDAAFIHPD